LDANDLAQLDLAGGNFFPQLFVSSTFSHSLGPYRPLGRAFAIGVKSVVLIGIER